MDLNRLTMTGRLTRDPQLRSTGEGTPVCNLRLACNTARKGSDGTWTEKPNYFNVTVWGKSAEAVARCLKKGAPIAVDGRLEWSEWEKDDEKRESVEVTAEHVTFLGGKPKDGEAAQATIVDDLDPDAEPIV